MKLRILVVTLALTVLDACVPMYTLVKPGAKTVAANSFTVQPMSSWNAVPANMSQTKYEEVWTRNGPLLETVAFIGALPEGQAVIVQGKKEEKRVPLFRADMSPQDLASMVEASYRVRGVTVFNTESVDPVDFLGGKGLHVRYTYAPNDGISKKGSAVLRVIDKKLYVMKLEGVSSHYYDVAVPEFELLVATAELPK
jgi:hypothetical protein